MLEHGVIEEFACNINMAKFGYYLSFITMVRIVNANNSEKIAKKLMKIGEIYSVDMITGVPHWYGYYIGRLIWGDGFYAFLIQNFQCMQK